MCRKKFIIIRKAFISLLIGIFLLSGCGKSGNSSTQTTDNYVNKEVDTGITEKEDNAETDDNDESSGGLPKPSAVPVNILEEDIHYHIEDGIDLLRSVHRCVSDEENIYLAYNEPDLYVMPVGADKHSPANIDNPEGMNVCNVAIDTYGRIHLLMTGQNYDDWHIWRLDENYQVDEIIDISAYCETKQIPIWFLIDKDGTYYLQWPMNRNAIIIDSEGILKHKLTPKSLEVEWIYEAAVGKDGQIYLVYDNKDKKLEIGELDVENCSIKNEALPLCFPDSELFSAMSGGTDTNLLLFSPYSGVWACDIENGVLENRVPLSDIDFGTNTEFWPLTFLPDGRLLLAGIDINDVQTKDDDLKDLHLKYISVGK